MGAPSPFGPGVLQAVRQIERKILRPYTLTFGVKSADL